MAVGVASDPVAEVAEDDVEKSGVHREMKNMEMVDLIRHGWIEGVQELENAAVAEDMHSNKIAA
jgi:hypothetical protein